MTFIVKIQDISLTTPKLNLKLGPVIVLLNQCNLIIHLYIQKNE